MARTYTADEVEDAIHEAGGILTDAAKILGCSYRTIHNYVRDYYPEQLQPAIKEAKRKLHEEAKACVRKAVRDGDWRAAKYVLNSHAAHEGWGETKRMDVTTKGDSLNDGFLSKEKALAVIERAQSDEDE